MRHVIYTGTTSTARPSSSSSRPRPRPRTRARRAATGSSAPRRARRRTSRSSRATRSATRAASVATPSRSFGGPRGPRGGLLPFRFPSVRGGGAGSGFRYVRRRGGDRVRAPSVSHLAIQSASQPASRVTRCGRRKGLVEGGKEGSRRVAAQTVVLSDATIHRGAIAAPRPMARPEVALAGPAVLRALDDDGDGSYTCAYEVTER